MKILIGVLVALIVFAALVSPLLTPHPTTTTRAPAPAMYIADGPTPTPTPDGGFGGQGGCHGFGC